MNITPSPSGQSRVWDCKKQSIVADLRAAEAHSPVLDVLQLTVRPDEIRAVLTVSTDHHQIGSPLIGKCRVAWVREVKSSQCARISLKAGLAFGVSSTTEPPATRRVRSIVDLTCTRTDHYGRLAPRLPVAVPTRSRSNAAVRLAAHLGSRNPHAFERTRLHPILRDNPNR